MLQNKTCRRHKSWERDHNNGAPAERHNKPSTKDPEPNSNKTGKLSGLITSFKIKLFSTFTCKAVIVVDGQFTDL